MNQSGPPRENDWFEVFAKSFNSCHPGALFVVVILASGLFALGVLSDIHSLGAETLLFLASGLALSSVVFVLTMALDAESKKRNGATHVILRIIVNGLGLLLVAVPLLVVFHGGKLSRSITGRPPIEIDRPNE